MKNLLICLLIVLAGVAHGAPEWQPARTFVFCASITKWPEKAGLISFPGTRYDEVFIQQLKTAGVPAENIVFLQDSAATHAAMSSSLAALATRCAPGDTLIFCFQGHGGRKLLYCYDYDSARPDETVFHMDEIFPILNKVWKGNRLFLIGDCCCSGSLHSVLRQFEQKRPDVRVATLASVAASNSSTGNWTFTEGLIRSFAGDPIIDRNHDGQLTMDEIERFLHDQMKYKEDQLAALALSASFEKDFILRSVARGSATREIRGSHQIGEVLDARDSEGKWYPSEILDAKPDGSSYHVHYVGWDDKWNEWVDATRLRPIVKGKLNVGQHYEVQWQKQWYPATITKTVEDYFYFVHYEGYEGEDDEWITAGRARLPKQKNSKQAPEFAAAEPHAPAVGEAVAARWHTDWYRGRIAGLVNGTFAVRYDDDTNGKLSGDEVIAVSKPAELHVGDRVLAVWGDHAQMYPGRVQGVGPQKATVRWEDGSPPSKVPLDSLARIRR
ncbi:MAG: Tudor-knot domain-containing protein [Chthoniobacter sp.]|uniref:Tudor-knot domain-containing protein n=1 Tax=Chthoniobacter sp. TaxID=2510640 RepID=UPI0032AA7D19